MLVVSTASIFTWAMIPIAQMVNAWLTGKYKQFHPALQTQNVASFHSGLSRKGIKPDLAFAIVDLDSCLAERHGFEKFFQVNTDQPGNQ